MKISSSIAGRQPNPTRKAAQEKFEAAREEYETFSSQYNEAFTNYQNKKERNLLIGAAVGFVLGGAAIYYSGLQVQHGAELALPAIVGAGLAAGATWLALGGASKKRQPKVAESYQKMDAGREAFREELLAEMNDQGVRDITQPRWEQQKNSGYRQTPSLNERLDALTNLADSRLSTGWNSELATAQDDPLKFQEQQSFIVGNPEVRQLIEK